MYLIHRKSGVATTERRQDLTEDRRLVGPYELHDFFYICAAFWIRTKQRFSDSQNEHFENEYDEVII